MKAQVLVCLVVLTIFVGILTAEAIHDNKETEELSGTQVEDGSNGPRTGRQGGTEAARVRTLSELIFSKESFKGLVNNILLWVLFLITDYYFQFV